MSRRRKLDGKSDEEIARMLERGEIEEGDVLRGADDEISVPRGSAPADAASVVERARFRGERIRKLETAWTRISIFAKVRGSDAFDYERDYRGLYDDIRAHEGVWFDRLFDNPEYASRAAVVLGTLCTILRQRGDLLGCQKVMPTYMKVLEKYKRLAQDDPCEIDNAELLCYKANLIRINCGCQLPDKRMATRAFRNAAAYESKLRSSGSYDENNCLGYDEMMEGFLGHGRFDEVSDDDLFMALTLISGCKPRVEASNLELRECGYCDKRESHRGDFKKCSRCHNQSYCSKKCQTKDWKCHKHLCGKKNTTNLSSEVLLGITKVLVNNYAMPVERAGGAVSGMQKNDAKAALVKQLKLMLTSDEFKHFNSPAAVRDAGTDSSFAVTLAEFFARQPGYEIWGELRAGLVERMREEEMARAEYGALNISDDAIGDLCGEIVQMYNVGLGGAYAESGGISDLLDPIRQGAMLDSLARLMKKFALERPRYNSHAGLVEMQSDVDFRVEMAVILALCCDERGPQIDTIAERIDSLSIG